MSNIDEFVSATNRMIDEEQKKQIVAANEKALYGELKDEAANREKVARATIRELELAKLHAEKAQGTYTAHETLGVDNTAKTMPNDDAVYVSVNETTKKSGSGITGFIAGAAVVLLLAGGWKLYKDSKAGDVKLSTSPTIDANDNAKSMPEVTVNESDNTRYNYQDNEIVIKVDNSSEEVVQYEALTTENFENLVAVYANKYSNQYSNVNNQDIIEFATVANIDLLAEENPELIKEVAGDQTKEEFLNDAAKLIGATVMNNFNVWNSTHSTEEFIRVSDIIYGEQKAQMLKIEEYVDRIAAAVNQDDADLVNQIVSEFLTDMNSGDLSKLDDGVGFAAQVNIAMIADGIARNHLNKENFDMFQVLKTSEKYVSNIFAVYERCTEDVKTRTR